MIAETSGDDVAGATMGLGWELALDMIDYGTPSAEATMARARQTPRLLRSSDASAETRLFGDDVQPFFDATRLDAADQIEVADGRFCVAVVVSGDGAFEGEFGSVPVRSGQTFALPASVPFRVRAGTSPVRVVRCMGPVA